MVRQELEGRRSGEEAHFTHGQRGRTLPASYRTVRMSVTYLECRGVIENHAG